MSAVLRLVVEVGLLLALVAIAAGQVSRGRLERFAGRQQLTITAENGQQVIRYLSTTRRWRTAGVIGGWVASEATQPQRLGEISTGAEWTIIIVGWFLGAVIAEVRVEHLQHGSIRAASLERRSPGRYVRPLAWALVPVTAVVALATGAATALAAAGGRAQPDWTWAGVWLTAALAVAATVWVVQHVVLHRPQPRAAADIIEADDAIRSRSLHVLSAAGAALVLSMVLNQIGSIHPVGIRDSIVQSVRIFGFLGVALLGWLAATSIWPPLRTTDRTDSPAVGAA